MFRGIISSSSSKSKVIATTASSSLLISSHRSLSETTKLVQHLRARTDAPILDCKKALVECGTDDVEKCVEWLKKKGLASADKKVSRETAVGILAVAVARKEATGEALGASIIQLCCETDFTAQNEKFLALAYELSLGAEKLIAQGAWEALKSAENFSTEFQSTMKPLIASVGENIQVRRVIPLENVSGSNIVGCYAHGSSAIAPNAGSMVSVAFLKSLSASDAAVTPEQQEFANDLAQTCVANYFVGEDTPVGKFDMLGYSGDDVSVSALTKKQNLQLCRIVQMSHADAEGIRDIVKF